MIDIKKLLSGWVATIGEDGFKYPVKLPQHIQNVSREELELFLKRNFVEFKILEQ